jgi:hypothetical protein
MAWRVTPGGGEWWSVHHVVNMFVYHNMTFAEVIKVVYLATLRLKTRHHQQIALIGASAADLFRARGSGTRSTLVYLASFN